VIAIIAAMAEELECFLSHIHILEKEEINGSFIYLAELNKIKILLVKCGIGKVESASLTTYIICKYQPKYIINTGTFGTLSSKLNLFDLVVADNLLYHDVDVTAFGYSYGQVPQRDLAFKSNKDLVSLAQTIQNVIIGAILSGDQFISNKEHISFIQKTHFKEYDVLGVDMESASIAQVCTNFKIPFIIIRIVSDNLHFKGEQKDFAIIAQKCSIISYDFVRQFIERERRNDK
jgi:adenosylhomocysteine nucleosidase